MNSFYYWRATSYLDFLISASDMIHGPGKAVKGYELMKKIRNKELTPELYTKIMSLTDVDLLED